MDDIEPDDDSDTYRLGDYYSLDELERMVDFEYQRLPSLATLVRRDARNFGTVAAAVRDYYETLMDEGDALYLHHEWHGHIFSSSCGPIDQYVRWTPLSRHEKGRF